MKVEDAPELREFLEDALKKIYNNDAYRVAIFATSKDDDIIWGYYNCNIPTKLLYSGYMQQDAMLDTLAKQKQNSSDDSRESNLYEDPEDPYDDDD